MRIVRKQDKVIQSLLARIGHLEKSEGPGEPEEPESPGESEEPDEAALEKPKTIHSEKQAPEGQGQLEELEEAELKEQESALLSQSLFGDSDRPLPSPNDTIGLSLTLPIFIRQ